MQLSRQYSASRTAVRRALKHLEAEGWLAAVQGSGRRVARAASPISATIGMLARGSEFTGGGPGTRMLAAITRHIAQRNHALVLHTLGGNGDERDVQLPTRGIDLQSIDGAIVYAPQYKLQDVAQLAQRIPVVSTPHDASAVGVPSFVLDYAYHASVAVQALAAMGHQRIALIAPSHPHRLRIISDIRRGFDLGRQLSGLPLDEDMVIPYGHSGEERDYSDLYAHCRAMPHPPTALLSNVVVPLCRIHDYAAADHDPALSQASLVCLSDVADAGIDPPMVADFACDLERVAADAVACLDDMLHGRKPQKLYHPCYGRLRDHGVLRPPIG